MADDDVTELARRIASLGGSERARVYRMSWWTDRLLRWAMSDDAFKTQLFRFVDVFPAMAGSRDVVRHVREYFSGPATPRAMRLAVAVGGHLPAGLTSSIARRQIERMARQFIVGTDPADASPRLEELWRSGSAFTVDLLGEKVVTDHEADRYAARVADLLRALSDLTSGWPAASGLERDDLGAVPRVNISIKPTALSPRFTPLTREDGIAEARARLLPMLRSASRSGAFVWFDMEHYDVKALTTDLFRDLLDEPELAELNAGLVVQAYLRDARDDLAHLIEWARGRRPPIAVRLVKGAYWDAERIESSAEGWPSPVFDEKDHTDASFESCVDLLHDNHDAVRAAFASHNLRSLAYSIVAARRRGIPDNGYELQMLYGMAEPMQAAVRELGLRLRVYAPMGELVPGMAYLVRRLLENTSNESFVRQRFAEGRELTTLLAPPEAARDGEAGLRAPSRPRTVLVGSSRERSSSATTATEYSPEPPREWRREEERENFARAVAAMEARLGTEVPAVIGGERVTTLESIISVDPARPTTVVATSSSCGPEEAKRAVATAAAGWEVWRRASPEERAEVVFGAAAWLRERRDDIAALEVFEAGKPWREADADVCEAIDFCEYYGREALRLARGVGLQSPPGEANMLRYQPRGVTVVIAPWNFPLAIPCGMTVAALATGNAVLLKPAEQTPAVAFQLVLALETAGLPPGVLGFLPGVGETIGPALVEDPDVALIVFTGSRVVGLSIYQSAAATRQGQRHLKRVIAEMGGKNALIVDADADLDQAVPAIVYSAFGHAGQKCSAASRLVLHDRIHDEALQRVIGAARRLRLGHPKEMSTEVGPVIDADAQRRIVDSVSAAKAHVVLSRDDLPPEGWFVGPTIVAGAPEDAAINREEVFGPVLSVLRARDFEHAIEIANSSEYALTAGVFSRSPANVGLAASELRAGNVYINRSITGAVVGRQPFGGYGLSGVGSKAGGPDYLRQFVDPRVITENTVRQGFAPEARGDS